MEKYIKKPGLLVSNIEGKIYLCYEYEVYEINETAARIIRMCDGKNSLEDITKQLCDRFQKDCIISLEKIQKHI